MSPYTNKQTIIFRQFLLTTIFVLIGGLIFVDAHTINYQLESKPIGNVIFYYMKLGFQHILPNGFDHILFVVGLYLLNTRLKTVIAQATAFTIAHTITLCLVMNNIIAAPASAVEPIIALSIVFIAIENMLISDLKPWRIGLVFLFGLVHGMGFASSLNELGLPRNAFYTSLISFNVGVEFGQISIILIAWQLFGKRFGEKLWYRKRIVYPLSTLIAAIAVFWTIERIFFF